jgi:hypothetical protein
MLDAVDGFYGDVLQHLTAWSAAPPKLREEPAAPTRPIALSSTALSSQDGVEPASDAPSETQPAVAAMSGAELPGKG